MGAPFLLAPALPLPATAEGLAAGVDASSSASSRFFSSALRAASAAFSAFFSAADLPLPAAGSSHLAASAASALEAASAAFLSSLAAFLALPDSFFALPGYDWKSDESQVQYSSWTAYITQATALTLRRHALLRRSVDDVVCGKVTRRRRAASSFFRSRTRKKANTLLDCICLFFLVLKAAVATESAPAAKAGVEFEKRVDVADPVIFSALRVLFSQMRERNGLRPRFQH